MAFVATLTLTTMTSGLEAIPLTLETRCTEQFFNGTPLHAQFHQATSTGAPVSLSSTFNSSSILPPASGGATGNTNVSVTATGAFDANGLRLGASAGGTVSVAGGPSGGGTLYIGSGSGSALFEDTLTLSGGPLGALGFLRLVFDLDGTFEASVRSLQFAAADARLELLPFGDVGIELSLIDTTIVDPFFHGFPIPLPNTIVIDFPARFGTPALFKLLFSSTFSGYLHGPGVATGAVAFDSTLTLLNAQVLDVSMNVISGGTIVSANAFVYPTGTPPAVSEPATLSLLTIAVLGIVALSSARFARLRVGTRGAAPRAADRRAACVRA